MKELAIIQISVTLAFASCSKDNKSDSSKEFASDSTSLKYVDCADTNIISLFTNDSITISVETWIGYNGPHPYTNERVSIKSNNPSRIMISFGKIQNNSAWLLDKDSLIDESLEWHNYYVSGGYDLGPIGFRSKYVGVKIMDDGKTYYGWIHTPTCYKMTEYAFDTSNVTNRKIFAGRLKK